jgi:hypothetical protein
MDEILHKKVSPPFEAYLYTHLYILVRQNVIEDAGGVKSQ